MTGNKRSTRRTSRRRLADCFRQLGILCLSIVCPSLLAFEYEYLEAGRADADVGPERLAISQHQFTVDLFSFDERNSLSWKHRYTQLDQEIGQPLHNGHLHHSRLHWTKTTTQPDGWQHDWSFGLAMSSNRFKNFEPDSDAWLIEGRSLRFFSFSEQLSGITGVQTNYLFNEYRVLPEIGLRWQDQKNRLSLTSSELEWVYTLSHRQEISLTLERSAAKWFVEDNDNGRESEVYLRQYRTELEYSFEMDSGWRGKLGAGLTQIRRLEYLEESIGQLSQKFEHAPHIRITLANSQLWF